MSAEEIEYMDARRRADEFERENGILAAENERLEREVAELREACKRARVITRRVGTAEAREVDDLIDDALDASQCHAQGSSE